MASSAQWRSSTTIARTTVRTRTRGTVSTPRTISSRGRAGASSSAGRPRSGREPVTQPLAVVRRGRSTAAIGRSSGCPTRVARPSPRCHADRSRGRPPRGRERDATRRRGGSGRDGSHPVAAPARGRARPGRPRSRVLPMPGSPTTVTRCGRPLAIVRSRRSRRSCRSRIAADERRRVVLVALEAVGAHGVARHDRHEGSALPFTVSRAAARSRPRRGSPARWSLRRRPRRRAPPTGAGRRCSRRRRRRSRRSAGPRRT